MLSTGGRWWSGALQNTYNVPNAEVNSHERDYRFIGGRLVEITPEYCAQDEKGLFLPAPDELKDFKASNIASGDFDESEAADILNLLFDRIFCRQFDQALVLLHEGWPEQDLPNLIAILKEESKSWNCPECQTAIAAWR